MSVPWIQTVFTRIRSVVLMDVASRARMLLASQQVRPDIHSFVKMRESSGLTFSNVYMYVISNHRGLCNAFCYLISHHYLIIVMEIGLFR